MTLFWVLWTQFMRKLLRFPPGKFAVSAIKKDFNNICCFWNNEYFSGSICDLTPHCYMWNFYSKKTSTYEAGTCMMWHFEKRYSEVEGAFTGMSGCLDGPDEFWNKHIIYFFHLHTATLNKKNLATHSFWCKFWC